DSAGALDLVAFRDVLGIAEQHGGDIVLLEVPHHPVHLMREFKQLAERRVLQSVDSGYTVAAGEDAAGFAHRDAALKTLDLVFEDFADFRWSDFRHMIWFFSGSPANRPLAFHHP